MTAEATVMAGRVQGLSQVLVGSMGAAGQAVVADLETIRAQDAATAPEALVAGGAPTDPAAVDPSSGSSRDQQLRSPVLVDSDQSVILARARQAVVAVNDPANGPHLGVVAIAWNGTALIFAAIGHSRRATLLRADDRITVTIDGPGQTYLMVRGRATLVAGIAARDALEPLLVGAGRSWEDMLAEDPDRLAVLVVPESVMTARRDPLAP